MDELGLKTELHRLRQELLIHQKIFNLMHTTLRLDEILYIILTALTAHIGLGFNRAILFLINEKEKIIKGEIGIGPATPEEANNIWTQIQREKPTMEELISIQRRYSIMENSKFNKMVRDIKIPLDEEKGGILASGISNGAYIHINKNKNPVRDDDPLLQIIQSDELVIIPLKSRQNVIGAIVVDNLYSNNTITHNDIRMLIMFAEQAGLAVEKSQLYERVLLKSNTDSLTGLFNHGYFQGKLEELLFNAKTNNMSALPDRQADDRQDDLNLSLIMLDIDNFKKVNDTFGHQTGDKILIELVEIIKTSIRKQDLACRYGGEEISIILPETNKDEAFFIAERIRQNIMEHKFLSDSYDLRITVSLGIATRPIDTQDKSELINYADHACLQAKKEGKNKTVVFYKKINDT